MTQDEIIRMAREAGLQEVVWQSKDSGQMIVKNMDVPALERFFNLAFDAGAAHEREKEIKRVAESHGWTQAHWTAYEESIVAAEREACAKVCESDEMRYECSDECAAAIRARGNDAS